MTSASGDGNLAVTPRSTFCNVAFSTVSLPVLHCALFGLLDSVPLLGLLALRVALPCFVLFGHGLVPRALHSSMAAQ